MDNLRKQIEEMYGVGTWIEYVNDWDGGKVYRVTPPRLQVKGYYGNPPLYLYKDGKLEWLIKERKMRWVHEKADKKGAIAPSHP